MPSSEWKQTKLKYRTIWHLNVQTIKALFSYRLKSSVCTTNQYQGLIKHNTISDIITHVATSTCKSELHIQSTGNNNITNGPRRFATFTERKFRPMYLTADRGSVTHSGRNGASDHRKFRDSSLSIACVEARYPLPLSPPEGGTKPEFAVFYSKIQLLSKKVCYKVSLCEIFQRHICSYIIPLSNGP